VRTGALAFSCIAIWQAAACRPPVAATACATSADCAPGWRCDETRRFCYAFSDAAIVDATSADAAVRDALQRDHSGTDQRGVDQPGADHDGGAADHNSRDSADGGVAFDATGRERSPGDAISLDQHRPDAVGNDVIAEGCLIGGNVKRTGAVNPSESCQYCDPRRALIGWTTRSDSEFCDDGDGCTYDDSCLGGSCQPGASACVGSCDSVLKACCGAVGELPCSDGGCNAGYPTAFDGGTLCAESCGRFGTGCCSFVCLPGLGCFRDECILCGPGNDRACTDFGPFCEIDQVYDGAACVSCGFENGPCCPGTTCPADPLLYCCNRYRLPGVCLYYACTN